MAFTSRQNEIIDAAIRLIALHGIQELTIRNLSLAIGVTEPALYRHFPSKTDIIHAVIRRFETCYEDKKNHRRGFDAIRIMVEKKTLQIMAEPALSKVMFCEEFFANDPDFADQMRQMMIKHKIRIMDRIQEGIYDGVIRSDIDPETTFRLIMGPVRLLFKQWGMNGMTFDLKKEEKKLLDSLELLLKKEENIKR